ncbi:MAG TPA: DUF1772 domain-containing protein [Actinophytocola sp.]|uniref:DUF1772 domain-containing protein n=1 Tax=Actinophytocola sp. TaxID=1872138 RepID=UPI002DC024E0|nr:DUF1772 domain-containing protein [Actinophytocola sp.]HEU5473638.1 DUF1772 domain-containing protein [Actinophytocola sp.]
MKPIYAISIVLSLLLSGLYAGLCVGIALNPGLTTMSPNAYVSYWHAVNRDYGRFMPPLFVGGILTSTVVAALSFKKDTIVLVASIAAAATMLAGIVLTIATLVPLNVLADSWAGSIPDSWSSLRDEWRHYHLIRTVIAAAGFIAAAIVPAAQLR